MITKNWMHTMRSRLLWIAILLLFPIAAFASVAGHVQFVAGDVRIVDAAGKQRVAQKGQEISEGDSVLTATNSSAQLKMIDGGILALRSDTELKVDTYVFQGVEDGSENGLLSLVKGGLRAITGLIGRQNKDRLKLRTPTATVGIRGTDHEPVVIVEAAPGTVANNPPGTYDKVNVGATTLTTLGGTAVIGPNQVGYAASPNQPPVLLPKLPEFYRATPTPIAKLDKKQQGQGAGSQSTSQSSSQSTTAGANNTSSSEAKADVASTAPVVNVANLTGVDANGNVLNLSDQTLTSASGQVQALSANTSINSGGGSSGGGSGGGSGNTGTPTSPAFGSGLLYSFPYSISGSGAISQPFFIGGPGLVLTNDSSGNLTAASLHGNANANDSNGSFSTNGYGLSATLSQAGSTLTDFGSNAATGLAWGRWQGGTISESFQYYGQDASGNWGLGATNSSGVFVIGGSDTQSVPLSGGSLHWITAPAPSPGYLPQVLTGSANYTSIGGTHPTDQNGNVGILNSASLGVNFSTQVVNASVNFSVAGNTWNMQSGAMQLDGTQFSTYSECATTCTNSVTLTKNGAPTSNTVNPSSGNLNSSTGSMLGFLTGAGLNGAALEYSVEDIVVSGTGSSTTVTSNAIQGVAAFSGPTQDVTTPFRAVGISDGWNNLSNVASSSSSGGTVFNYGPSYHGNIVGGEQPVATVVESSAGLTSFIGQASGYTAANTSITVPTFQSGPLNTINVGTATNTDLGSATIDGATISWGRWAGGTVNVYSLDGSTLLGTIDNSNRSIHWVTTSALTNSTINMPTSGTATYAVAGNTDPTDFKGNTGTLTSATLNADFTNAKVNTTINVSFNSATNTSVWNLTANNVPLSGRGFNSDTSLNGVNGIVDTVTCTGTSCAGSSRGYVEGHFIQGAQGAVMFYGMSTGNVTSSSNSSGTSISTFTPTNGATGLIVMKH